MFKDLKWQDVSIQNAIKCQIVCIYQGTFTFHKLFQQETVSLWETGTVGFVVVKNNL